MSADMVQGGTLVLLGLILVLFALLDGENPTRIEHLWQKIFRSHRDIRGGPFLIHTLAAIDMALWDITGKLWGVPVYTMLGGPTRDRIRVYHTPQAKKVPPGVSYEHALTPDHRGRPTWRGPADRRSGRCEHMGRRLRQRASPCRRPARPAWAPAHPASPRAR